MLFQRELLVRVLVGSSGVPDAKARVLPCVPSDGGWKLREVMPETPHMERMPQFALAIMTHTEVKCKRNARFD